MGLTWKAVSKPTELFAYGIEFAVLSVLVTNIYQYGCWRCLSRPPEAIGWNGRRPIYFLAAAIPLILAQPLAIMIVYHFELGKLWTNGSWWPNTTLGVFLLLASYAGFFSLTIGVFSLTGLHKKVLRRWASIFAEPRVRAEAGA